MPAFGLISAHGYDARNAVMLLQHRRAATSVDGS